jgi:hypothetical protein
LSKLLPDKPDALARGGVGSLAGASGLWAEPDKPDAPARVVFLPRWRVGLVRLGNLVLAAEE